MFEIELSIEKSSYPIKNDCPTSSYKCITKKHRKDKGAPTRWHVFSHAVQEACHFVRVLFFFSRTNGNVWLSSGAMLLFEFILKAFCGSLVRACKGTSMRQSQWIAVDEWVHGSHDGFLVSWWQNLSCRPIRWQPKRQVSMRTPYQALQSEK